MRNEPSPINIISMLSPKMKQGETKTVERIKAVFDARSLDKKLEGIL